GTSGLVVDVDACELVANGDDRSRYGRRRDRDRSLAALIAIVFGTSLLRRSAKLVERAVGAPGFGIEPRGAGNRQHVAMTAALGPVFRRTTPPARLEFGDRCRDGRSVDRLRGRRAGNG